MKDRPLFYSSKTAENLDFLNVWRVSMGINQNPVEPDMFNDLFNFKKQRTPKEAVGFYLFYACLIMGIQGFAIMLGA